MKRISPLIIAVALGSSALFGLSVAPAMADQKPAECSYPNASAQHPDWFAVGGQCEITYPHANNHNGEFGGSN